MPAFQTYADLKAGILRWMQDSTLSDVVGEMIAVGEDRLSRRLNTPDMEATGTLTIVNGAATLPTDLMELRAAYVTKDGVRLPLNGEVQADFNDRLDPAITGIPAHFTVSGSSLKVRPYPDDTYPISITYKQKLPSLSDTAPTNWLLTQASDLYLFNSIAMAEFYGWNDARLPLLKGWVDELVDEVNAAGRSKRYGVGPLVARAPVGDARFGWRF